MRKYIHAWVCRYGCACAWVHDCVHALGAAVLSHCRLAAVVAWRPRRATDRGGHLEVRHHETSPAVDNSFLEHFDKSHKFDNASYLPRGSIARLV